MLKRWFLKVSAFTFGTLISRITGLIRESVFAFLFGASAATDAFNVAFRIPNFLRDMFSESALSAAFVPTFCEKKEREKEELWLFASNLLNVIILVVGIIVLLGIFLSPLIVRIIGLGFVSDPHKFSLTISLTRIMFPFLLLVALASWTMGILISYGRFFIPAVAPAIFNIFSIALPLFSYQFFVKMRLEPILGMAYGVLLGSMASFFFQLFLVRKFGFKYHLYLSFKNPEIRRILKLYLPVVVGMAAYQINFLVNTILITLLEEKSITYLNYAYRVMHLPAGLFGVAVGSVALEEFSTSQKEEIPERINPAIKINTLLLLPAVFILLALTLPITKIIYERGRFEHFDSLKTAQALFIYAFAIFPSALARTFAASFYALKDTKTPALTGLFAVLVNITLNLTLMRFLRYLAFPLGTAIAALFQAFLLFLFLRKKIRFTLARDLRFFLKKVIPLTIGFGLVIHFLYRLTLYLKLPTLGQIILPLLIALPLFIAFAYILKIEEIKILKP